MRPGYEKFVDYEEWKKFLKFTYEFGMLPDNGTWTFTNLYYPAYKPKLRAVLKPTKANFMRWRKLK